MGRRINTSPHLKRRGLNVAFGVLLLLLLQFCFSACGYTRYYYETAGEPYEDTEAWRVYTWVHLVDELRPRMDMWGRYPIETKGDTIFYYAVTLYEKDTITNPRFTIEVTDPTLAGTELTDERRLAFDSSFTFPGGATSRTDFSTTLVFGPFSVPIPRPRMVYVHQSVRICTRDTDELVAEFPLEASAVLTATRRSHFSDFLNGN